MTSLETISTRAHERKLDFLIGGGHAVIVHGHPRNTFDIDLIVRRTDRDRWTELAGDSGYSLYHEGPTFLQFNAPEPKLLPLDLMFVSDDTFTTLLAGAVAAPAGAAGAKVVSLRHLHALKCHAIKHGHEGRIVKDADHVIRLAQANRLDVNQPELGELFLKHCTQELYEKSDDSAPRPEPAELDFPDWSGMDDSSARITPEAAFRHCEEYRAAFPELTAKWESQRPEKNAVEFVL